MPDRLIPGSENDRFSELSADRVLAVRNTRFEKQVQFIRAR
jgi:hypothetical protein